MTEKKKIMLVDDEENIIFFLHNILKKDFEVIPFCCPDKAMNAIKGGIIPDLIITDYNMSPFNGFELLQKVKESKPDIPFILVTGSRDIPQEILNNFNDIILKPSDIKIKIILDKISKIIVK